MYKSSDSLVQRCFSRLINAKAVKNCSECSFCPTMLFVEEVRMLTVERNHGRKATCECSVMIGDDVQIIFRDDGITYDPTNADNPVESLRSYVVANLMLSTKDRRSLVTTGYNRSSLRLEK